MEFVYFATGFLTCLIVSLHLAERMLSKCVGFMNAAKADAKSAAELVEYAESVRREAQECLRLAVDEKREAMNAHLKAAKLKAERDG